MGASVHGPDDLEVEGQDLIEASHKPVEGGLRLYGPRFIDHPFAAAEDTFHHRPATTMAIREIGSNILDGALGIGALPAKRPLQVFEIAREPAAEVGSATGPLD